MKILLSVFLLFLFFLGVHVFVSFSSRSQPPSPPPLDNLEADYFIRKDGENFMISYKDADREACCIMVGSSPFNLDEYVGKKVKIKGTYLRDQHGNYKPSEIQCIAGKCHMMFGKNRDANVVNIEQLKVIAK
jgi:hypothetical protein